MTVRTAFLLVAAVFVSIALSSCDGETDDPAAGPATQAASPTASPAAAAAAPVQTASPTPSPTPSPTSSPTPSPTSSPTPSPTSSPSGKIAFISNRDGRYDIWVMNADGSNQRRLTSDGAGDGSPAWSPDGQEIAFSSGPGGVATTSG